MVRIDSFLSVARAPFLLLPVTLIAAGSMAARLEATILWWDSLIALVGLVALHMAVNIFNEVSDMRRGIDLETVKTPFSGGSGTLPAGGMSSSSALVFGIVCTLTGASTGAYFLWKIGMPMLILILTGAFLVLGYTDFLARIGFGEIAAGLGLGALPILGMSLIHVGRITPAAIAISIPAALMTFNLLLLNEFPDEAADRKGGRKNLLILFGRRAAAILYVGAGILVPFSLGLAIHKGILPPIVWVALAPSLFFLRPAIAVLKAPEKTPPIPALGANVSWNLLTNVLVAICLFVEKSPF